MEGETEDELEDRRRKEKKRTCHLSTFLHLTEKTEGKKEVKDEVGKRTNREEAEAEVNVLQKVTWRFFLPQFISQCRVVVVLELLERGEERKKVYNGT